MRSSILSAFLLVTLYQMCNAFEKVKLRDVQALTLTRGRYTVGRKPIPQLTCTGLCKNEPDVVQCNNVGFDGIDYQWKCNANLDKNVKFGKISVNCEGYDYPNDPYIIAGSCGLEYQLAHRDHHARSAPDSHLNDEASSAPFWIFIGFVAVFLMIMFCKSGDDSSFRSREGLNYRGTPSAPPPAYTPHPPGFKEYADTTYQQAGASSTGPGFWSGLGLGGLAGYMFGGRNASYTSPPVYTDYNYYRPSRSSENTFYQDDCYTDRSSSGDTYNAEGFGSTKRR